MTAESTALFGFDSAFLRRLERLSILSRRPIGDASAGPRRSPRRGSSVEFADFREYLPGDDFRRIDWNTYARLDRLFLRLYTAEEMTTLTLLLDRSPSMSFGEPRKIVTAGRLAAVISFVGLSSYDRVAVGGWGERTAFLPPLSGKTNTRQLWRRIADIVASPSQDVDMTASRRLTRRRGAAIVLCDLLTDADWRSSLRDLQALGQEVSVIQILSPDELKPVLRGDWKLRDSETGREVEITSSPRLLKRYSEELSAYTTSIEEFCRRHGIAFVQLCSDIDVERSALRSLRAAGMIA